MLRRILVRTLCVMAVSAPLSARADTFGAQLHYVTGTTHVDGREVSVAPPVSEPGALRGARPRLHGEGTFDGVGMRFDLLLDSTRLGLGAAAYGVDGVSVATDSLDWGLSTRTHAVWGSSTELFFGWEIGQGPVYPYLDLRGTLTILQAELETHVEGLGHVGTTHYNAIVLGAGPRFGALIPIGHSLTLDVAVAQRLIGGLEQTTLFLGVGYWENDRTDPFSQELKSGWRGQI